MKKNKKIIVFVVLATIILAGILTARDQLSCRYKDKAYEMRFEHQMLASQSLFNLYYDSLGYFPHSVDEVVTFARRNYFTDDTEENVRGRMLLNDLYVRGKSEIIYIPLYDYKTKIPMSFIFLSAGIDGKMNNTVSPNDTLYLNTWWSELDVYNYGEAVLVQDYWRKLYENWTLFDEEQYSQYYPPYPDLVPHFSLTKYLWGKKDWIIQIGPIS